MVLLATAMLVGLSKYDSSFIQKQIEQLRTVKQSIARMPLGSERTLCMDAYAFAISDIEDFQSGEAISRERIENDVREAVMDVHEYQDKALPK